MADQAPAVAVAAIEVQTVGEVRAVAWPHFCREKKRIQLQNECDIFLFLVFTLTTRKTTRITL